jgi:hypothetical protein
MPVSVTRPVGLAIERAKRICFQPFNAGKWFTLGFCVFLASLGEGGGGGSGYRFGGGPGGRGPGGGPGIQGPIDWVRDNLVAFSAIAAILLIVVFALAVLLLWLGCRGKFMFLDGVVRNHGAVVEPWHALRAPANSLLRFYIILMLVALGFILVVGGLCLALAWPDLRSDRFGEGALAAIVIGGVLCLPFFIALAVVKMIVVDFVMPAMYLRGESVRAAWITVRREVLAGNASTIFHYVLMKIVLTLGIAVIAVVIILVTCCIAALPYIGTVIMLPLFVFSRCYSLHFLEQFGPQWRIFPDEETGPYCRTCGYNLYGNVSGVCPECGTPIHRPDYSIPPAPPTSPQ